MSKTRTFQLYLSTQITDAGASPTNNIIPVDKTKLANVTWQVDFKSLFGNYYNKFKRCSVRAQLISEKWTATDNDENTRSGYLAINLPATGNASTTRGTPILCISPSTAVSATTLLGAYIVSSLGNVQGVDITMPAENQFLNVMFVNDDALTLMATVPEYQILFQFELSEPVE